MARGLNASTGPSGFAESRTVYSGSGLSGRVVMA